MPEHESACWGDTVNESTGNPAICGADVTHEVIGLCDGCYAEIVYDAGFKAGADTAAEVEALCVRP